MSRPIKFRTFFNEEGAPPQMIYFHEDDFIRDLRGFVVGQVSLQCDYISGFRVKYCPVENTSEALENELTKLSDTIWGADNSPLMQFTGLKDVHGRDIYEGDVVKFHYFGFDGNETDNNGVGEVVYDSTGVFLIIDKRKDLMFPFYETSHFEEPCIEVIGNIFESPEALNE